MHFQKGRTIHRNVHTDCLQKQLRRYSVPREAYRRRIYVVFFIFKISHSYLFNKIDIHQMHKYSSSLSLVPHSPIHMLIQVISRAYVATRHTGVWLCRVVLVCSILPFKSPDRKTFMPHFVGDVGTKESFIRIR